MYVNVYVLLQIPGDDDVPEMSILYLRNSKTIYKMQQKESSLNLQLSCSDVQTMVKAFNPIIVLSKKSKTS